MEYDKIDTDKQKGRNEPMEERLRQQLDFALEIDKEKIFSARHTFPGMAGMKMMQSMHGTWQSWRIC